MGLQVRVRHALGERLVDLADRPVERPLLVGRAREADVKIPSVSVASEHCALFVHNGQWVLQDMSGGATFINGSGTDGPTPLCVGDVIVLGTDASPATIEVDPAGVAQGRSGHPAETHDAVPVARASKTTPRPLAQGYSPSDQYAAAPMATATATSFRTAPPAPAAWNSAPVAQDDSIAGWAPAPASGAPGMAPATGRRKRKASAGATAGGIVAICGAGVLVLVFIIVIIVKLASFSNTVIEKPREVVVTTQAPKSNNMFDIGSGGSVNGGPAPTHVAQSPMVKPRVAPKATPTPDETTSTDTTTSTPAPTATQTPAPTPDATPAPKADTPPAPTADAAPGHKDQDGFDSVKTALQGANIGQAIVKAEDYRRQHITENFKDMDGLIDEAMDQLWWTRISTLFTQQSSVMDRIKKNEKDVREETSAAFKKILQDERKPLDAELVEVQKHLNTEMGYTATEAPQLENKETMKSLRDDRDAGKFGAWKQSTLKYIKSHHGAMPWDG